MPLDADRRAALLAGRYVAALATENDDGSIHMTAVWFLFDSGEFFVATSSRSRKAANLAARPRASIMVDVRRAGDEKGATAVCRAEILSGEKSREMNERIHHRYMSEEALADPRVGPVMARMDDVTVRLTPESWIGWDMRELDEAVFAGHLIGTPGYLHPLD